MNHGAHLMCFISVVFNEHWLCVSLELIFLQEHMEVFRGNVSVLGEGVVATETTMLHFTCQEWAHRSLRIWNLCAREAKQIRCQLRDLRIWHMN